MQQATLIQGEDCFLVPADKLANRVISLEWQILQNKRYLVDSFKSYFQAQRRGLEA